MAALTWRNVDAPNLSSGQNGVLATTSLLGNASDALSRGLAQFGQAQTDQANGAALQNAMRINDPQAYQTALQNGALLQGVDPSKVDARTLAALQGRSADLIQNAASQQALDYRTYQFDRTKGQDANTDAAAPIMARIQQAYASGDTRGAQALEQQNADVLGRLTPDQQAAMYRNGLSFTGSNINNNTNQFGLDVAQENRSESRDVAAAANRVNQLSLTPDDRQYYYNQEAKGLNPNEQAALARQLGITATGSGGGSVGGTGTATGLMTGGAQLPSTIKTAGDFVDNKGSILSGNGGKGTATGLYQITSDTMKQFGQQALGDNWRDADIRDASVQDKVGSAIWNSVKDNPTAMQGRWATITPADAQAWKGKSWDDVKSIIAQRESGADLAQYTNQTTNAANVTGAVQLAVGQRNAQNNANSAAPDWLKATTDTSSPAAVAQDMSSGNSALKGTSANWIANRIEYIRSQSQGRVNAAQAGAILERSLTPGSESAIGRGARGLGALLGIANSAADNGMVFDENMAAKLAQDADSGKTASAVLNNQLIAQSAQQLQVAQQNQQQALAVLQQAQRTAMNGGQVPQARLQQYKDNYDKAAATVQALQKNITTNPDNIPEQWRPKQAAQKKAETDAQRIARQYGTSF